MHAAVLPGGTQNPPLPGRASGPPSPADRAKSPPGVKPAPVRQATQFHPVGATASFALAARPLEPHAPAQLGPVLGVQGPQFGVNRHGRIQHAAPICVQDQPKKGGPGSGAAKGREEFSRIATMAPVAPGVCGAAHIGPWPADAHADRVLRAGFGIMKMPSAPLPYLARRIAWMPRAARPIRRCRSGECGQPAAAVVASSECSAAPVGSLTPVATLLRQIWLKASEASAPWRASACGGSRSPGLSRPYQTSSGSLTACWPTSSVTATSKEIAIVPSHIAQAMTGTLGLIRRPGRSSVPASTRRLAPCHSARREPRYERCGLSLDDCRSGWV